MRRDDNDIAGLAVEKLVSIGETFVVTPAQLLKAAAVSVLIEGGKTRDQD